MYFTNPKLILWREWQRNEREYSRMQYLTEYLHTVYLMGLHNDEETAVDFTPMTLNAFSNVQMTFSARVIRGVF